MSIQQFANQFVCDLVAYEPGKPIEETARELGLDPETIVKLASNENPSRASASGDRGDEGARQQGCTSILMAAAIS